jgi:release factor glutamine methyltransferase
VSSIAALLAEARQRITPAEARLLMRHVLGRDAAWLAAHDSDSLAPDQARVYGEFISRRAQGEPIAYLTGEREFYGRSFIVTPDVLIPRPETELLVELGIAKLSDIDKPRILELGTGSGCIAISLALALPNATITAIDISEKALVVARANTVKHGAVIELCHGDWLADVGERYDLIVSNPPYVAADDPHLGEGDLRFEPALALASGGDGLDSIRNIVGGAGLCLAPDAWLMFEHGYDQAETVGKLLALSGFRPIESHRDLSGIARVAAGRWQPSLDSKLEQRIN